MNLLIAWSEEELLTACIWAEARGEPQEGMWAVGHVILNRVHKRMAISVKECILAPKQFSWTTPTDVNYRLVQQEHFAEHHSFKWLLARDMAKVLLTDPPRDCTDNADHYLNITLTRTQLGGSLPKWADDAIRAGRMTCVIGRHTFLRLLDGARA